MARQSLRGNLKKPDAGKATEVARKLTSKAQDAQDGEYQGEMETVSYSLPVELIELVRDLAEERLKLDRAQKREARRRGEKPPQARRSASAIIREAIEAHRGVIEAELKELRGQS